MEAPLIRVLNSDSTIAGYVRARIGLRTYAGPITRFTDKTIWTRNKDGSEAKHRFFDGNVPGCYRNRVRKAEFIEKKI